MAKTWRQQQEDFDRHERAVVAECSGDTPESRFTPVSEIVLAAERRAREARAKTTYEKDAELRAVGVRVDEHPLSNPCGVCGYDRRYNALQKHCLYCEAKNV